MAFPSLDLFARIIPTYAWNGSRFDTLAIETPCGGMFMSVRLPPDGGAQGVMNALPCAIITPAAEILIDTLPQRIVFGQHPPLDTAHDDIHEGIDDLAHVQTAGASARFCRRD